MKHFSTTKSIASISAVTALIAGVFCPLASVHANEPFDGKAYLIWDCGESTPCWHLFEDINTDNTYTVYADGFAADNYTDKTFSAKNVNHNSTTFALKSAFDAYKEGKTDFSMQSVMEYEDSNHDRLALNPLEAPRETNAYTHFGDRNFKVMIKAPGYVGASLKNATDGYEPDFGTALNSIVYRDISGSTEANPTVLRAIPQQTDVILSAEGGAFDSVEAINLENADAITITKVSGGHKIVFNSAYFDRIIFKVKKGEVTGYVQIFRTAVQVQKTDVSPNSKNITAVVYFDEDKTCDAFVVSAKLVHKDGTTKTIKLSPAESHDDGFDNIEQGCLAVHGGGTGLQKGYYKGTSDVNLIELSGIYFTVTNAGSTNELFTGTISGSKKGIYLNLEDTPMENKLKYGTITPEKN